LQSDLINIRYSRLIASTGSTMMLELKNIGTPNGNRIFAKLEYRNPGGSHYDRVYLTLFRD
jgi:O-acetylserine dependent cystathionine beta-synthase